MLERFGRGNDRDVDRQLAWTCVLVPQAAKVASEAVRLAEQAVQADPKNDTYRTTLGAALYRAGRFEEAAQKLSEIAAAWEQANTKPEQYSPAYALFFLAMIQERLGHADQAQRSLEKAVRHSQQESQTTSSAASRSWNRRLTLQLLQREAEQSLTGSKKAQR
jgi:Tfp pilus assembly protein PilF